MAEVVHLRAIDPLPGEGDYLVITRVSRVRAFEYFIDASPSLAPKIGDRVPPGGPGYATVERALEAAQTLADQHGSPTIYVQHSSIFARPFYRGEGPL